MFCQILKAHLIVCYFDLELAIAVPVFYGEPNLQRMKRKIVTAIVTRVHKLLCTLECRFGTHTIWSERVQASLALMKTCRTCRANFLVLLKERFVVGSFIICES